MGVRHSVSYIKLLVTGWTAGAFKQGEGRVVAVRRNIFHHRYHYVMQPRAFGDIYCFPVPIANGTDENLLQTKLAETSVVFKILQQFNKHF